MNTLEIVVTSVLAAMGGAALVVGALATWLGSVWKERIERHESLVAQIDVDLRARRIPVYEQLWASMKVLPKWPRDTDVTYERLHAFSVELRDWYFEVGGLYLSGSSRDAYADLQDKLRDMLMNTRTGPVSMENPDDYETVRARCSELRKRLAMDVASRRESATKG